MTRGRRRSMGLVLRTGDLGDDAFGVVVLLDLIEGSSLVIMEAYKFGHDENSQASKDGEYDDELRRSLPLLVHHLIFTVT